MNNSNAQTQQEYDDRWERIHEWFEREILRRPSLGLGE